MNLIGTSSEGLYTLRLKAVELYKEYKNISLVSKILKIRYATVYEWIQRYIRGGIEGLKDKRRGFKKDKYKYISSDIMNEIINIITTQLPEDYRLQGIMWTSRNIVQLIYDKYKIPITRRTVQRYLKDNKLSFLKGRGYQQETK